MSTSYNSNTCMQLTAHVSSSITVQHCNLQHTAHTHTHTHTLQSATECCRALQKGHNANLWSPLGQPARRTLFVRPSSSLSSSPPLPVFPSFSVLSPAPCRPCPLVVVSSPANPSNPIHRLVFSFPCSSVSCNHPFRFLDFRESRTPPILPSILTDTMLCLVSAFCSLSINLCFHSRILTHSIVPTSYSIKRDWLITMLQPRRRKKRTCSGNYQPADALLVSRPVRTEPLLILARSCLRPQWRHS